MFEAARRLTADDRASTVENAVDSIYWVISRDCNQRCPHCYNDSAPGAPG
jgi:MoaA/NifB/PqqE/SkfB family radical SAM enzyme